MPTTKRLFAQLAASLTAITLLFTIVIASATTAEAQTTEDSFVILLDVSGSMGDPSGQDASRTKIDVAKDALTQAVTSLPDGTIELGLRTFSGCSTSSSDLINSVELADAAHKSAILANIASVTTGGPTNIANGLTQALADLPPDGERTILLVSDGVHTCGADPCVTASDFFNSGVNLRVNTIGFEVTNSQTTQIELQCIAAATGGVFTTVDDLDLLFGAIDEIINPVANTYCAIAYVQVGDTCVATNPAGHISIIEAFVCPPAPVAVTTTTGTFLGNPFLQSCSYVPPPPTCDGQVVTVDVASGDLPTNGDDVILGTTGPDTIDAGDGNDIVCAGDGDDVVTGGDGNDTLIGGNGNDRLTGDDGDDTIMGQQGSDVLRGGPGSDVLEGGAAADRLFGGIDDDTLRGGAGDDYLGGFGGIDGITGGDGNDIIFGGFGADNIAGGDGDDVIRGLVGDDVITGGNGNDEIFGDRGNDTLDGDAGNDTMRGGNANDVLRGGDGDDTLSGGRADDQLSGEAGTDTCTGNTANVADTADKTCETKFGIP